MVTKETFSLQPQSKDNNALDKKTLERINRLSCQQIIDLQPKYINSLTCGFDERYARLVVAKGSSINEQRELLYAIIASHKYVNTEYDDFGGSYISGDTPAYFEEWDISLAFNELITSDSDMTLPEQLVIQQAESIPQLIEEEGQLRRWMDESVNRLLEEIHHAISRANSQALDITSQFKDMRDGSISRLLERVKDVEEKLQDCEMQKQKIEEENHRLKSWYEDWQRLRQEIIQNNNAVDIAEIDAIDDPKLMTDAIDAIMSKYTLQKENEELRAKQEAWRESEEYKAERTKWEKANKQRIDVQDFKNKLLRHAATYTVNESEKIRSLVLNLNEILRATAWEAVSPTILEEALNVIRKNEIPQVAGDFVLNKHVANEVNGVETGATGVSINK